MLNYNYNKRLDCCEPGREAGLIFLCYDTEDMKPGYHIINDEFISPEYPQYPINYCPWCGKAVDY